MNKYRNNNTFQVFEHSWLNVGATNEFGTEFKSKHFILLTKYLNQNPTCGFFDIFLNRIKFKNYVGVIKVAEITIEVLPKIDYGSENAILWQSVLIEMLKVGLNVKAKNTTFARIETKYQNVLDVYIQLFLDEVKCLVHQGLVKKYRIIKSNQTALKGKLVIHKHLIVNVAHAERFYLSHHIYNRDNIFNQILNECLYVILSLKCSDEITAQVKLLLIDYPECSRLPIKKDIFDKLTLDRKTERYKKVLELAKMILFNYHPDVKGGNNNILAIMVDMNFLWESYIFNSLRRAAKLNVNVESIKSQQRKQFWVLNQTREINLKPDILIETKSSGNIILDTKWKYLKVTSSEDIRQLYTYGKYFNANNNYLVYPLNISKNVEGLHGKYFDNEKSPQFDQMSSGLIYLNIISNNALNKEIGKDLLDYLLYVVE